jgi:hypothetical protein
MRNAKKKKMIIKIKKGNGTMISANTKLEEQNLKKKDSSKPE